MVLWSVSYFYCHYSIVLQLGPWWYIYNFCGL
jgi:hypothetical protein